MQDLTAWIGRRETAHDTLGPTPVMALAAMGPRELALTLGGAVRGGRVLADWPGLAPKDRFEGRDLRITTDLRAALRPILLQHLQVPRAALDATVLPGSAGLPALDLLHA